MMKVNHTITHTAGVVLMALSLAGCRQERVPSPSTEEGIRPGEAVVFATYMTGGAATKAIIAKPEAFSAYRAVADDYTFTVSMYKEGTEEAVGSSIYQPAATVTGEGEEAVTTYPADGTLNVVGENAPLYWPGNVGRYGFKAVAGSDAIATDQSTKANLLLQDKLVGYGFEPLWNTVDNKQADNEDALNYRSSKEWYAANKISMGSMTDNSEYKKIPLFLQHQRAMITIRLKAGEGVDRSALAYALAKYNVHTFINSYGPTAEDNKTIQSYASESTVNYSASDYGTPASDVPTTDFTAIVEPHNYLAGATNDVIAEIRLSGQRFTFYASNDSKYAAYTGGSDAEASTHMNGYNLGAGQHLVITATLGRESRKIVITAYVADWDETVTTSIVDDYGQAGDPIQIKTRQELYDFLNSDKNKAGNVAIIVPNALNLDKKKEGDTEVDAPWDTPMPLNATLNLAGATLRTDHRIFETITSSGSLVNGTVTIGDVSVTSAIAACNEGSIEHVNVLPRKVDGTLSQGKATKAGLVETNNGHIVSCHSELPVQGTGSYLVGGIAVTSNYKNDTSTMPIIDGCTVNARVDGTTGATGGGIVGEAVGRVTNNSFVYGRTLLQNVDNFKNTIHHKADGAKELRAYDNAWPTSAGSNGTGIPDTDSNKTPAAGQYDAVIDSQKELNELLTNATYNANGKRYRISNDFSISKTGDDGWKNGKQTEIVNASGAGTVFFALEGNDKTITTDAMLFSNILGSVSNLSIRLSNDLIPIDGGGDAVAPLAYSVNGDKAKISNIKVKAGEHSIKAKTVAGVVVWAYENATVENCQSNAALVIPSAVSVTTDARIYSGGIVANAALATITRCIYHKASSTLYQEGVDTQPDNIFFGGILGSTSINGTENPSVIITDCTSFFEAGKIPTKGAIVGYAQYPDPNNNHVLTSGMGEGCEGNWWGTSSNGIGSWTNTIGTNDQQIEKLLGKRNAVTPLIDEHYED